MIAETALGLVSVSAVLLIVRHVVLAVRDEKPMIVFASLASFVLTLILSFVALITFQTLYPYHVPIKVTLQSGIAMPHSKNSTLFRYSRNLDVSAAVISEVYRRIDCGVSGKIHSYDLPPVTRKYLAGTYDQIERYAVFPLGVPIGTRCQLYTSFAWTPSFAMSPLLEELPVIDFRVVRAGATEPELLTEPPPPTGIEHSDSL